MNGKIEETITIVLEHDQATGKEKIKRIEYNGPHKDHYSLNVLWEDNPIAIETILDDEVVKALEESTHIHIKKQVARHMPIYEKDIVKLNLVRE